MTSHYYQTKLEIDGVRSTAPPLLVATVLPTASPRSTTALSRCRTPSPFASLEHAEIPDVPHIASSTKSTLINPPPWPRQT